MFCNSVKYRNSTAIELWYFGSFAKLQNICRIVDNCELWICGYLDFKICNVSQYRKSQLFRNCLFAAPSLVIDKVLVNEKSEGSTKILATELEEVKEAVDNDFASMFRKRNTL
ncbi:hypothetical protein RhiirC2_858568 [Rhizophagus irregularis]|uniref:Uncharacterized protein n=1 Tax=Rhizophagus irregularis TaxID=588596 RepID=A0A2N1M4K2_9GLOM|nr:hypothetical protein RhiirC2_858568 [Rhizophagus irregularis]